MSSSFYFCIMQGLVANIDLKGQKKEGGGDLTTRKLYIESYGCQMNYSDSEIVTSIMKEEGFVTTSVASDADVILINTCSIREKAERTVRGRLRYFNEIKKGNQDVTIGVLGCMAERLKSRWLEEEKVVDLVLGPDSYRDLPKLVKKAERGERGVNTFLSREETYADIAPVRLNSNGITAFVSIMRGCDNMCSFCVVPFTRGRERSRNPYSIVEEAKALFAQGYREITLLGQNVDSYKWSRGENNKIRLEKKGVGSVIDFAHLLEMVARVHPELRVRFSTSHPKDLTDEVLHIMRRYDNLCKHIHLPAQSGNSRILRLMNRTYDREWYLRRVDAIRSILGEDCGISSDIIAGFCSETEEEHGDTLSLMDYVRYDFSYMFCYSERPGTLAYRKYKDDIPMVVKKRRLQEIIFKQKQVSLERNRRDVGRTYRVLVEGRSKKSDRQMQGRNSANKVIVFDGCYPKGIYLDVRVYDCTVATLLGKVT